MTLKIIFVATGSVTSQVSYSTNGRPAVVERKTTKYSTDPSDFANEIDADYKISERKNSRGGVYSVTKVEKFQDDERSKPVSKVIRRGSVKELKEKFVRKDSSSKVTDTKRSSVERHDTESETESYSVSKQYRSSSKESKSFLNSEKKASNVQEVMTFMRNADRGGLQKVENSQFQFIKIFFSVQEVGDSKQDAEARALLNKFLGATALMTSIENSSGLSKDFLSSGGASSKNQRVSDFSIPNQPSREFSRHAMKNDRGRAFLYDSL